ncbi:MAG: hypothetical protein CVV27_04715 [Candidatus Melainabacteria bacterium HGW-Melainabacteria-1]|nr:MAG: hypothetical protein CVV27_04715 [Candidatus Melainabacteria bacterium HGW-Melainabacteria-1]
MTTSTATRPIPATDDAACARYNTTTSTCGCPDALNRDGGSYTDPVSGERTCKHRAYVWAKFRTAIQARSHADIVARPEPAIERLYGPAAQAPRTYRTTSESCTCTDYQMQDRWGYACEHILALRAQAASRTSAPSAERRQAMTERRESRTALRESDLQRFAFLELDEAEPCFLEVEDPFACFELT